MAINLGSGGRVLLSGIKEFFGGGKAIGQAGVDMLSGNGETANAVGRLTVKTANGVVQTGAGVAGGTLWVAGRTMKTFAPLLALTGMITGAVVAYKWFTQRGEREAHKEAVNKVLGVAEQQGMAYAQPQPAPMMEPQISGIVDSQAMSSPAGHESWTGYVSANRQAATAQGVASMNGRPV